MRQLDLALLAFSQTADANLLTDADRPSYSALVLEEIVRLLQYPLNYYTETGHSWQPGKIDVAAVHSQLKRRQVAHADCLRTTYLNMIERRRYLQLFDKCLTHGPAAEAKRWYSVLRRMAFLDQQMSLTQHSFAESRYKAIGAAFHFITETILDGVTHVPKWNADKPFPVNTVERTLPWLKSGLLDLCNRSEITQPTVTSPRVLSPPLPDSPTHRCLYRILRAQLRHLGDTQPAVTGKNYAIMVALDEFYQPDLVMVQENLLWQRNCSDNGEDFKFVGIIRGLSDAVFLETLPTSARNVTGHVRSHVPTTNCLPLTETHDSSLLWLDQPSQDASISSTFTLMSTGKCHPVLVRIPLTCMPALDAPDSIPLCLASNTAVRCTFTDRMSLLEQDKSWRDDRGAGSNRSTRNQAHTLPREAPLGDLTVGLTTAGLQSDRGGLTAMIQTLNAMEQGRRPRSLTRPDRRPMDFSFERRMQVLATIDKWMFAQHDEQRSKFRLSGPANKILASFHGLASYYGHILIPLYSGALREPIHPSLYRFGHSAESATLGNNRLVNFRHHVGIYTTPHARTAWLTVTTGTSNIMTVPVTATVGTEAQLRLTAILQAGDGMVHTRGEGAGGESRDEVEAPKPASDCDGQRGDGLTPAEIEAEWMASDIHGLSDDEDIQGSTGTKNGYVGAAPLEKATTPSLRMTQC